MVPAVAQHSNPTRFHQAQNCACYEVVESTKVGFKEALQTIMKQLILSSWFDEDVEDLLDVGVYYFCAL